ncbi:nitrate reductase [uncultured Tateyamaria sp.]|uniref:nitrate reductase n=1 Tax=uncultured Tateyamaria sp. TaxID=455651 RepID=UPI0026058370|nr:nitrate reductase [uncultured Tateyamaria sp.]
MKTRTTCPYCGVGCGVLASADGTVTGDPDHPANFGRLCSKGAALGETIELSGRLLAPIVGGQETDWETALDLVAAQFQAAIREHGPDSVAFYVSGQLLTEDYYVANKLMKGFIGSANIDTNSRLCMASSVAGHKRAFGTDTVPGTYEDLEEADLIVVVGSNLAWCHPVLHQRIAAAKAARPGMRVVNIDPRRTATTELADLHLQIAPDGDVALFNGLLAHLSDAGHVNRSYVNAHVAGFESALFAAAATDATQTGLSAHDLAQFYTMWAGTQKVVTVYSQGVNQSTSGADKVNAILNCHLATGRIGKPGCGPFSVTGQPNAMGGREVGGLANMLANHLDIENADHRDAVQGFWDSPTICTTAGLKAVDLFEACANGKIKALWVMSTNPAVSLPGANKVADAITAVPFTVVSDIMARTDTGDLADVLLPATGWGEKDGTVTNSERRISRQRAFLPAPGQARPDWKIISDVAARMGWADAFAFDGPAEIFAEYVALSTATAGFGRDLDLSIFADADYAALIPTQWPRNSTRFFANGGFFHPDGKARMLAVHAPEVTETTGFRLNTGRIRDQWHTMTRTGKAPRLGNHLAEPYVEIHPRDAEPLGVTEAMLIRLSAGEDHGVFRALLSTKLARGQLFAPMHWTRQRSASGWVNGVVHTGTDPVSGQPALKAATVTAARFDAKWYGFLASRSEIMPEGAYCAVARTSTGWQAELAGDTKADAPEDMLRALIGPFEGDVTQLDDPMTGLRRLALRTNGVQSALLFIAPDPVAVSRTHVISQIGTPGQGIIDLSGLPEPGRPDPGATVCSCMSVGINTLRTAIAEGVATLDELATCTGAGTNCGSCKPELAALLATSPQALAAE